MQDAGPAGLRLGGDDLVLEAQLPAQRGKLRFGAHIGIRALLGEEALMRPRGDHAAGAAAGLEHRDWMTAASEFPGGAQPGDASSHNDGLKRHGFVLL